MVALKAFLSQAIGLAALFLLVRSGYLPPLSLLEVACLQAVVASLASAGLRSDRWWLLIHLVFAPSLVLAWQWALPPWVYLVAFLALTLVYWTSFRTQVPLFLSNRQTVHRLARWLPADRPLNLLDIGSGTGGLLASLARLRPDWSLHGIETAPAPYALSRWLNRRHPNVSVRRGDFWRESLAPHDVVYAFLSPVPMAALWRKALREMRRGSWLVSNSFPVAGVAPDVVLDVGDTRGTLLYCYRIPGAVAAHTKDGL